MIEKKVSVIVPIYKAEQYMNDCVESLVNQTHKNLEIILVDDGSPDNCPKMCDEWRKKDNRIRVIHKENGGPMSVCIEGVKNASSEYVTFVDSDDFVENNFVEVLINEIINNDADVSICDYTEIYSDGSTKKKNQYKESMVFEKNENFNCVELLGESYRFDPCRWNKMFKKSTIEKVMNYFDEKSRMAEDVNLTFCVFSVSQKVVYSQEFLHNYRIIEQSLSHKKSDKWDSYLLVINKLKEFCVDYKEQAIKDMLNYFIVTFYYLNSHVDVEIKDFKKIKQISKEKYIKDAFRLKKNKYTGEKFICFCLKFKLYWLIVIYFKNLYKKTKERG